MIALFLVSPYFGPGHLARGDIRAMHGRKASETTAIFSVLEAQDMKLNRTAMWHLARSIREVSEKHGFEAALVLAIIEVESRFNHQAVSPTGARGLMQVQPVAASVVTKEVDLPDENIARSLENPIINVKIGTAYLKHLRDIFADLRLTLIAYNRGPTRLRQSLAAKAPVPFTYANKVLLARHALEANWGIGNSSPATEFDRVSQAG